MAVEFSSTTSDYLDLASAPVTAPPLTIACWFNKADATSTSTLVGITYAQGSEGFVLYAQGAVVGDLLSATTHNNLGSDEGVTASGFSANTWHHGAATYSSSSNRTAWIDGTAGTTNTNARATITNPNRVTIGALKANSAVSSVTDGAIAEVGIWSVVLDAAEVGALAEGVIPILVRPASLVFYAPLIRSGAVNLRGGALIVTGTAPAGNAPRLIRPTMRPLMDANAAAYSKTSSYARVVG